MTSSVVPDSAPRPSLREPAILLATWFGSGYLPRFPGTWGSLAALPIVWLMAERYGPYAVAALGIVLLVVGTVAAAAYLKKSRTQDPGEIVIDEVAAQWLVLALAPPDMLWTYAAGFVLFRVFDIAKPWPVSWVDRRVGGGFGVMLDDVLAAVYAGAGLVLLRWVIGDAALS